MTTTPDFTWLFVKTLAGLILVLGLAVVFVRFVLPRTRFGRQRHVSWVKVLDRFAMEPHKSLYLVKMGDRYLVLGATEHSIQMVTEIAKSEGEKIEAS